MGAGAATLGGRDAVDLAAAARAVYLELKELDRERGTDECGTGTEGGTGNEGGGGGGDAPRPASDVHDHDVEIGEELMAFIYQRHGNGTPPATTPSRQELIAVLEGLAVTEAEGEDLRAPVIVLDVDGVLHPLKPSGHPLHARS